MYSQTWTKLAEEGVDEPVAYEAAAEAEKQRLEAERERLQAKSVGQTFVEEVDFGRLLEVAMEGATKAFAAGQQVQQRQQSNVTQQPVRDEKRREERREPPERSPVYEEVDLDGSES